MAYHHLVFSFRSYFIIFCGAVTKHDIPLFMILYTREMVGVDFGD